MDEQQKEQPSRHFAARLDLNLTFNAPVVLIRYDDAPQFYQHEHRRDGAVITAQNLICWE